MDSNAKPQILAIDCVRFASASLVVAFHYLAIFPLAASSATRFYDPGLSLPGGAAGLGWFGWVGVEIFFIVSGYVIAMSAATAGQASFLRRRALRLAPAAWVCASATALVLLAGSTLTPGAIGIHWLRSIFFIPFGAQIDTAYWTLGIELCFYLFVALWLREGRDNAPRIERVGLGIGLLSAAYWTVAILAGLSPDQAAKTPFQLLLMPHGAFFALGIALWSIRARGATATRIALAALAVATGMVEIWFRTKTMVDVAGADPNPAAPILAFGIAIIVISNAHLLQRPLARTIGAGRLATIGRMTYPLYLLNQNVGAAIIVLLCHAGVPGWAAMLAAALTVLAMAYGVAVVVEPTARRWLAAILSSRRGPVRDIPPSASPRAG
ncbi:MAG: acyltransferase [Pseudomonadota bacterium]